jgi:hypothetical protein
MISMLRVAYVSDNRPVLTQTESVLSLPRLQDKIRIRDFPQDTYYQVVDICWISNTVSRHPLNPLPDVVLRCVKVEEPDWLLNYIRINDQSHTD